MLTVALVLLCAAGSLAAGEQAASVRLCWGARQLLRPVWSCARVGDHASPDLTAHLAGSDAAFYDAKIKTAEFYFENVFNRTDSLIAQMNSPLKSVMGLKPEHFSFN